MSRFPVNTPVRINARGVHDILNGQRPCPGCPGADFMSNASTLHRFGRVGRVVADSGERLDVRFGDRTLPMKDLWLIRAPDTD